MLKEKQKLFDLFILEHFVKKNLDQSYLKKFAMKLFKLGVRTKILLK